MFIPRYSRNWHVVRLYSDDPMPDPEILSDPVRVAWLDCYTQYRFLKSFSAQDLNHSTWALDLPAGGPLSRQYYYEVHYNQICACLESLGQSMRHPECRDLSGSMVDMLDDLVLGMEQFEQTQGVIPTLPVSQQSVKSVISYELRELQMILGASNLSLRRVLMVKNLIDLLATNQRLVRSQTANPGSKS